MLVYTAVRKEPGPRTRTSTASPRAAIVPAALTLRWRPSCTRAASPANCDPKMAPPIGGHPWPAVRQGRPWKLRASS
eukprot:scaffold115475_cov78-Phaeocystis_antarctica.AAC.1